MSRLVGKTFARIGATSSSSVARMSKADLVRKAQALNIDIPQGATKQEIVELIKGAQK